jgi:hypothetical protein
VVHDPSDPSESRQVGQILKFRRRRGVERRPARPSIVPDESADELDDLAQYEDEDVHIDYRHRMIMNVMAVVVVALLVGVGVWLADTIADMEKIQDCTMQGRQNCAPIEIPAPKQQQ